MKNILILLSAIVWFGCQKNETNKIEVQISGELRAIMHQGKMQANIGLDTVTLDNLVGLGAYENLNGELLVINEKVFHSFVQNDSLIVASNKKAKATLFVSAKVQAWDTIEVAGDDVTQLVYQHASKAGLKEPFPFQLIGTMELVDYHVINFDPENGDIANHKEGALKGQLTGERVTILGFYSTQAKGIYTHHDSDVHMHVINEDQSIMGHVDGLEPGEGMFNLLLPRL